MKKLFKIFPLVLIILIAQSCSKDFLNEEPKHFLNLETIYSTPIEAEIGLTGAYSRIISKHMMQNMFWFMVSADELTAATHANSGVGSGDHRDLTTPELYGMLGTYTEPIVGISNINLLLNKVEQIEESSWLPGRKDELMGEAYFLRGYAFYMLAMVFRDVPIQLEIPISSDPKDNYMVKSTQEEVLDQAIIDFEKAIDLLPNRLANLTDHDARGRGSKWAALAFKSRIHMWREQWSDANDCCNTIIAGNQFAITPRWVDIFAGENNNEEVIWQSQGQSREEYDFMGVYRWYCEDVPSDPAPPFMVEKSLTDMFEQPYVDVRLEYSIRAIDRSSGLQGYGGRNVKQFHVPSNIINEGVTDESRDKNFPLIRLAEVKLMKAEAIIQSNYGLGSQNDVLDILNELRARTADPEFDPREEDDRYDYDADLGCIGISPLTVDQVDLQALKDEKYRELAFEAVRWVDLLRWSRMEDNYASVMTLVSATSVDRLYAAIPQQQIDANGGVLVQNPGY